MCHPYLSRVSIHIRNVKCRNVVGKHSKKESKVRYLNYVKQVCDNSPILFVYSTVLFEQLGNGKIPKLGIVQRCFIYYCVLHNYCVLVD